MTKPSEPSGQSESVPHSDPPERTGPDTDALAVDAVPDEVRLHGDTDETDQIQPTTGGPQKDPQNDTGGPDAEG
jgi:hypothetical protein